MIQGVINSDTISMRVLSLFAIILFVSTSFADDGGGFGILFGLSVPDAQNSSPHQIAGVKGLAFLTPQLSLGGYFLESLKAVGTGGQKFDYDLAGMEISGHMVNGQGDTFFGMRVGITKVQTIQ